MKSSDSTDKIDAAMARVQARLAPVDRNKGVTIDAKEGKTGWKSRYATLEALWLAAHDALSAENVVIYQGGEFVQGSGERLVTRLAHEGQWIESSFPVKASRDGAQGFGGGVSFAKRWGLAGMVGLVAADDPEEQRGYRDETRTPKPARVAAGIGAALDAIRSASNDVELRDRAARARKDHPTGEAAATIEKCLGTWFVTEIGAAQHPDALDALRDLLREIKPRTGSEVREAIAAAERRLLGPQ